MPFVGRGGLRATLACVGRGWRTVTAREVLGLVGVAGVCGVGKVEHLVGRKSSDNGITVRACGFGLFFCCKRVFNGCQRHTTAWSVCDSRLL